MNNFRNLERPFLAYEAQQKRTVNRKMRDPDWDMEELSMRHDDGSDGDSYGQTEYRKCGIRERLIWLRTKYKIKDLMDALQRIQTRRIAKELGDLFVYVAGLVLCVLVTESFRSINHLERGTRHVDDRLQTLEQRLSRVVGVRRVD